MKGTITTIKSNAGQGGGFGFIRDENGQDRFFHLSSVTAGIPAEGRDVDFEGYALKGSGPDDAKKNNGLRARNVRVAS